MRANSDALPSAPRAEFWAAAFVAALAAAACFALGVFWVDSYGMVLFLATPFVMGFVAGFMLSWEVPYRLRSILFAGIASIVIIALGLLVFAFEGLICLAMAVPLAVPCTLLGGLLSLLVTRRGHRPQRALSLVLLAIPALLGAEKALVAYPVLPIVSRVEINAPPETVWRHVIGFAELAPPQDSIFRLGIAYPVRARIEGQGVGAVRYCEFSTGPFVEPITVWEPPQRLAFDVSAQPEPMHEWSPYRELFAPHLKDGLESRRGEFLLIELEGGRTLLQGTTWYRVNMGPQLYWRRWSDFMIGRIHRRVLNHVKALSERSGVGENG